LNQLTCETFDSLEHELKVDFLSCYQEAQEEIQNHLEELNVELNQDKVHALFRSVHSLKGNCAMVFLDPAVDLLHQLEELVSDLRDLEVQYEIAWGDFIMEVSIQLQHLLAQLAAEGYADGDAFMSIRDTVVSLNEIEPPARPSHLESALAALKEQTTEPTIPDDQASEPVTSSEPETKTTANNQRQKDMDFFESIATQLDAISWFRRGRTRQEIRLGLLLNDRLKNPTDPQLLYAAICLHDLGMALLPQNLFNKQSKLSMEERNLLEQHPAIGAGMLNRMQGWEGAAQMVASHHEWYNGKGYPDGLAGEGIPVGSRIIAIIDAFMAITGERADRNVKKGVLSAAREITNGAGSQFDPEMSVIFTDILRQLFVKKNP